MADDDIDSRQEVFASVFLGLMKPLVRVLISQGITAPAFYRIVKRAYVAVAEEDLKSDGFNPTASRIRVMTGVHRKDVNAFRSGESRAKPGQAEKVPIMARVLGKWLASDETTDDRNRPLPLPRSAQDGPCFDKLVKSVNRDVWPRTVLDELLRQGLVTIDADGLIHADADGYVDPADMGQKLDFFSENVGDHLSAAAENLLASQPRYIERAVLCNRLLPSSITEIEKMADQLGNTTLNELNRIAHQKQSEDMDDEDANERFRFGIFFYHAAEGYDDED